jgi:hypothetical protein
MQFLPNILPESSDRWEITNGSMSGGHIRLNANGTATAQLTITDIAYIPKAFQIRIRHNVLVNWKNPQVVAELHIAYEDGEFLHTVVPLNASYMSGAEYVTINVSIVPSKKYSALAFVVHNTTAALLDISLYELRPSLDLDEGLQNDIESMVPQLVYKYNESNVNAATGVETSVIQLPVSVNKDTNLFVSAHLTGTCVADVIECSLRIDGEMVKAFPVKQTFQAGQFSFGIPSLIAFVKRGTHAVQLAIKTTSGAASIVKEFAFLALEGKGVLGGSSGEYPHAEVFQTIPLADFYNKRKYETGIITETDVPEIYTANTFIPLSMNNLTTEINILCIQYGISYSFANPYGNTPISPKPDLVYTDVTGTKAQMTATYTGTITNYEEYGLCETVVDTTAFNPVYSTSLQEVSQ